MATTEILWRRHPLFGAVPGLPDRLAAQLDVECFAPREQLAAAGEAQRALGVVLSGVVRLTQQAPGMVKLTRLLGAPNTFGDAELLHGIDLLTDVHAMTEVQLVRLPRSLFFSLLAQHPRLALAHARAMAAALCLAVYAERETFASLDERAASLVLDYAELMGSEGSEGKAVVSISNAELARNLGCTRRGLLNVMRRWRDEGVLDRPSTGELEILDLPRLKEAAVKIRGSRRSRLGAVSKGLGRKVQHTLPYLRVVDGPDAETVEAVVSQSDDITVGRAPQCSLVLNDPGVAPMHCRVFTATTGGRCWVEDLGSVNGTWVDGRRVERRAVLRKNAELKIGQTTLVLVDDNQPREDERGQSSYLSVETASALSSG